MSPVLFTIFTESRIRLVSLSNKVINHFFSYNDDAGLVNLSSSRTLNIISV